MDRETKLRRLNAFRRSKPHCSASALGEILSDIKANGLPDLTDRISMRKARDLTTFSPGPYRPIMQSITCIDLKGDPKNISVANPVAALHAALEESTNFMKFFKNRLRICPASPEKQWNIILYSDAVTLGNVIALVSNRKFQAMSWSFLEFGVNALIHEETWFTSMAEFSTTSNSLSGGLSQTFGSAIKCLSSQMATICPLVASTWISATNLSDCSLS